MDAWGGGMVFEYIFHYLQSVVVLCTCLNFLELMLNISYSDLQCFQVIESCANIHPVNGVLKGFYYFFYLEFFSVYLNLEHL